MAGKATLMDTYTNSLGMNFRLLSSGAFMMGSPVDEPGRHKNEEQHQVILTRSFYMQTTTVTQMQWKAVIGSNPSYFQKSGGNCPVEKVSWDDVQVFITELNKKREGTYRLPTEAEWEYAARAGSTTAYANGNIEETECGLDPNLDAMGWYSGNAGHGTHPVAQKQPNAWGLYDMHGNVWEWCQDWFDRKYPAGTVTDPTGPVSGAFRVKRGGAWSRPADYCRSAIRRWSWPGAQSYLLGFRLVMI